MINGLSRGGSYLETPTNSASFTQCLGCGMRLPRRISAELRLKPVAETMAITGTFCEQWMDYVDVELLRRPRGQGCRIPCAASSAERQEAEAESRVHQGRPRRAAVQVVRLLIFGGLAMPWALVIALTAAVIWLRRILLAVARMIAAGVRLLAHEVRRR